MTPRDWWSLTVELDERVPAAWSWRDGHAIIVEGYAVLLTIFAHQGGWAMECERRVSGGPGYYDAPEWRHDFSYSFAHAEDLASEAESLIK